MRVDFVRAVYPDRSAPPGAEIAPRSDPATIAPHWPPRCNGLAVPVVTARYVCAPVSRAPHPRASGCPCGPCRAARALEADVGSAPPIVLRDVWAMRAVVVRLRRKRDTTIATVPWAAPVGVVDVTTGALVWTCGGVLAGAASVPWETAPIGVHPDDLDAVYSGIGPALVPTDADRSRIVRTLRRHAFRRRRVVVWEALRFVVPRGNLGGSVHAGLAAGAVNGFDLVGYSGAQ